MTNFKQARSNRKRGSNIKDGPRRRQSGHSKSFLDNGFIRSDWNKWVYTWLGDFPVFHLAPGAVINDQGKFREGLIARHPQTDKEILFPYGTSPADIAGRLNDEIMGLQADVADPLPAEAPIPFLGEPCRLIIVEGQEIGSEIPF